MEEGEILSVEERERERDEGVKCSRGAWSPTEREGEREGGRERETLTFFGSQ